MRPLERQTLGLVVVAILILLFALVRYSKIL